ncbi:transposase [Pseudaminobacter sp. NGMCC 1.201702]|uniref:transposase n=1 Tax=Pseudaminobacter sp. NGMCC 1.201702 TaxID=3391825 RepID=UPI0039EEDFA8
MIEAIAERLDGALRQLRRRWSDEFKAQLVAEALEPGASVSAIAHRVGIHPSQLFAWRRDARHGRRAPSRLPGCEAVVVQTAGAMIEVVIGNVVVRAGANVDETHLQRVIRAVRSA